MSSRPRRSAHRLGRAGIVFALLATALFVFAARQARPAKTLWGDEPTYVAMAESLARDGDLLFGAADRLWVEERKPGALILQRAGERLAYSKPIVYPLLASPLVALFGEPGMRLFNLLVLVGALILAWDFLYRFGDRVGARATWVTFVVGSPIVPYALWRMSESLQLALALAGLVLATADLRFAAGAAAERRTDLRRVVLGGLLLGLLVSLRLPNLLVAAAPVAAWAVHRRLRTALLLGVAVLVSYGGVAALTGAWTGSLDPYRAERTSFDTRTGYPEQFGAADTSTRSGLRDAQPAPGASGVADDRFTTDPATHRAYWRTVPEATRALYSALYALIGRHTGVLIYFPALWILLSALRRVDRLGLCLLGAALALFAFYLLWLPGNYFGGSTFLGNRYWVAAYPLVLIALPGLPSSRAFLVGWPLILAIGVSAALGTATPPSHGPQHSQAHATRSLFRLLPAESTAAAIDGWTARRWSGEVVRFVDHHAAIGLDDFQLRGGLPATEVLVPTATRQDFLFLAQAEGSGQLVVRDWRRREEYELAADRPTLVRFAAAQPWRVHATLPETRRHVAALRLRFAPSATGSPDAGATLRYLGDPDELERPVARRVRKVDLPEAGVAGETAEGWIGVRNESTWSWAPNSALPVYLRYRFVGEDDGTVLEGPPIPLPTTIPPRGTLRMPFTVTWPERAGRYELTLDLEETLVGPFAERAGAPLSATPVTVESARESGGDGRIER